MTATTLAKRSIGIVNGPPTEEWAALTDEWAAAIRSKWQNNVEAIFDVGLLLCTCREELGPAAFWVMVRDDLKWSKGTASKLMAVGSDERLLKVSHAKLPANWDILYKLRIGSLTDEQFEKGIESGVIHAGMERRDIALLKPPKERARPPVPLTGRDLIEEESIIVRKKILSVMLQLSEQEKKEFLFQVQFQLDFIKEGGRKTA